MLSEMSSAELSGCLAYLEMDDEQSVYRMAKAFSLALAGTQRAQAQEEVIDTTSPEFAAQFKGFTGGGNEIKYG